MTQNAYLSVNKLIFCGVLLLASVTVCAQKNLKPKLPGSEYQNFLKTQWWLGLRVGMNYAQPNPITRYTSISPIDYSADSLNKQYNQFNLPGILIGLDISFYYHGVSLGFQPSFKQMRYSYSSQLNWIGASDPEQFSTLYEIEQGLNYLEIPLTVKYEIIKQGKVRPFVMAGMQYSFILGANKETEITHTDYMSGTPREYSGGSLSLNAKEQFQNYYGAFGGLGTGFDFFNIRTVLEITYMYGLSPITNKNKRDDLSELTTLGEVNDELNLNNINISLSFVFPLRYIDNTFQPY